MSTAELRCPMCGSDRALIQSLAIKAAALHDKGRPVDRVVAEIADIKAHIAKCGHRRIEVAS